MKRKGFTLAEVLITLGIIGIVAAMTIPTLITTYKEKQTVSQLKKAYSALSQAYLMALNEYGTPDNWDLVVTNTEKVDADGNPILDYKGSDTIAKIFAKYMKVNYFCLAGKKCPFLVDVNNLNGSLYYKAESQIPSSNTFQLEDGIIVSIGWVGSISCDLVYNHGEELPKMCSDIIVTLPISNKRSTLGKSQFYFYLSKNGIVPYGLSTDNMNFTEYCNPKSLKGDPNGRSCTAWVLFNENMDYLHCPEKLGWDKAKSCKD